MAEYIEREALYRKIAELEMLARDRYLDTPTSSPVYPRYMAQLGERTQLKFLVADFPAADVVEVVRCKDCKHATFYSCKNDACYRGITCEYRIGTDDENFFCSYGERRESDEGD